MVAKLTVLLPTYNDRDRYADAVRFFGCNWRVSCVSIIKDASALVITAFGDDVAAAAATVATTTKTVTMTTLVTTVYKIHIFINNDVSGYKQSIDKSIDYRLIRRLIKMELEGRRRQNRCHTTKNRGIVPCVS